MTASSRSPGLSIRYQRLWRQLRWHRRKLAALCAAVAVLASLQVLRPSAPPSVPVLAATHDLAAGVTLEAGDVAIVRLPPDLAPAHSLSAHELLGRTLAAPVARGTPLTRLSVAGDAWARLPGGEVAIAVRLQDAAVAGLLSPGQHVGLLAVDPRSPTKASLLTHDAVVLALPPVPQGTSAAASPGRLVVFEVPSADAEAVTSSAVSRYLTVIWGH